MESGKITHESRKKHSLTSTHTQCLTLNNFVDTKLTTIIRRAPNELSIIANVCWANKSSYRHAKNDGKRALKVF